MIAWAVRRTIRTGGEGGDCGVELGVGEGAIGHQRGIIRAW